MDHFNYNPTKLHVMQAQFNPEETLKTILQEESSDSANDEVSCSDNVTLSDITTSDSDDTFVDNNGNNPQCELLSKDKCFAYSRTIPIQRGRPMAQNSFSRQRTLPKSIQARIFSPFSSLKCFISQPIVDIIIDSTNHFAKSNGISISITEKDFWNWVAANLYIGILKGKNAALSELWDSITGIPFLNQSNILVCDSYSNVL